MFMFQLPLESFGLGNVARGAHELLKLGVGDGDRVDRKRLDARPRGRLVAVRAVQPLPRRLLFLRKGRLPYRVMRGQGSISFFWV